jgi:hypothetical protein
MKWMQMYLVGYVIVLALAHTLAYTNTSGPSAA